MSPSKTIKKLSTQVRTLQQKVRRQNKKIKSIKQLLNTLKREQLVDSEQNALLHNNFGNMAKELFNNQLKMSVVQVVNHDDMLMKSNSLP